MKEQSEGEEKQEQEEEQERVKEAEEEEEELEKVKQEGVSWLLPRETWKLSQLAPQNADCFNVVNLLLSLFVYVFDELTSKLQLIHSITVFAT